RKIFLAMILALLCSGCDRTPAPAPPQNDASRNAVSVQQAAPQRLTSQNEKEVTFYPAYGYQQDNEWNADLRGWVHERRKSVNQAVSGLMPLSILPGKEKKCDAPGMAFFKARSDVFECDDKFNERIEIEFDADPDRQKYPFGNPSDVNGIMTYTLMLSK